jgi:SAM-dependent methyltransferase
MSPSPQPEGYGSIYREFNSRWMQQFRRDAYGEDIGQHSWVTAGELRAHIARLELTGSSRLLDLGAGPCGPLSFLLGEIGCAGAGVEINRAALQAGRQRAASLGVDAALWTAVADVDAPLPFKGSSFDAAISLDVVLHLRDRPGFFREVARVLRPGGRFLFTDAGVVTGPISDQEVERRSAHGFTRFVPPGWNESLLGAAGFEQIESEDLTASVISNARGRLAAMGSYRTELEGLWGGAEFERQGAYLQTVVDLSHRGALSRFMYLARTPSSASQVS